MVTKTTVKSRTLQAIKGATEEATLKTIDLSFVTGKMGETWLSWVLQHIWGGISHCAKLFMAYQQGLVGLCKTYYGMFTELAKGRERKDRGGSRGTCRKMGRRGGSHLSWQYSTSLSVHTLYMFSVCAHAYACPGHMWALDPSQVQRVYMNGLQQPEAANPQSRRPLDSAAPMRSLGLFLKIHSTDCSWE